MTNIWVFVCVMMYLRTLRLQHWFIFNLFYFLGILAKTAGTKCMWNYCSSRKQSVRCHIWYPVLRGLRDMQRDSQESHRFQGLWISWLRPPRCVDALQVHCHHPHLSTAAKYLHQHKVTVSHLLNYAYRCKSETHKSACLCVRSCLNQCYLNMH